MRSNHILLTGAAALLACGGWLALAQDKQPAGDHERKVKEAEVPRAALEALRKAAQNAAFTEFAEEVEHGHKFYEGSYKGPNGNVDVVVTESGDLVVIEEIVPADGVPAAVRAALEKAAGKDAKPTWEKKTVVMYEVHFRKEGKSKELVFTPDGRQHEEEGARAGEKDEDEKD